MVNLLRKQGIRAAEFFTIGKRVSFVDLRSALPKLHEFQPDVIVGVGGNNAMSAAKALLACTRAGAGPGGRVGGPLPASRHAPRPSWC